MTKKIKNEASLRIELRSGRGFNFYISHFIAFLMIVTSQILRHKIIKRLKNQKYKSYKVTVLLNDE